jgi:hypothetical protein
MEAPWFRLVLGILATWRVAHFLAHEDGPWDSVVRLRRALGESMFARLLDCFQCVSLWAAAPIALVVGRDPFEWVLAWLGLSGGACVLQRVVRDPVAIQMLDAKGGDDVVLRTEAVDSGDARRNEAAGASDTGAGSTRVVQ